ncbi:Methylenetetrahydrofolate reductase [Clostridium bornimense]|uniref:Methylenetetrahydrofolate reductase n=1 Tax=Clostridium bornimense TaxID=1216932 RepID=W6S099_9CLOT|nr:bifunctional homocysteine S-methyltransferase/methylenetetrahydrofolate reductase [Clostridium bornimense]CDM69284.1 Methylenetetrahydrofolate reductase [Clostridium bornimense]
MIKDYLKDKILVTDGAMGTYYMRDKVNAVPCCELANILNPEEIKKIHMEYIEAGAKLIRTNTFAANREALDVTDEELKKIIVNGYKIAKDAAKGKEVFVAASIGPIRTNVEKDVDIFSEYKYIVDNFLEVGADIFVFETFSKLDYLDKISTYIKGKNKDAFIITNFAIMGDGFTRDGVSLNKIISEIKTYKSVDIYGFNCGSGPTHLYKLLKEIDIKDDIVAVLPNTGYPEVINERTIYPNNPEYFGYKMMDFKRLGFRILGGCCGTSPEHIKKIVEALNRNDKLEIKRYKQEEGNNNITLKKENKFLGKLKENKFVLAVELAPPFDTSIDKMMHCAKVCKDNNIDLVTIPDSPMSKVRVDSIILATKIKREIGIDAMPHICCRDKNTNAIRSGLMGAHIEDIRNVLALTGDPMSDINKLETKSVFNLNSFKLINLISEMNEEVFTDDNIAIGGALNLNVRNKDIEVSRMKKKIERGANFFLTQPIYDDETFEYLKKVKEENNVKILGGILPIVSYKNAQFLNNELPGVHIPEKYLNRFTLDMDKEEAEKVGIEIAVELGNKMKDIVDGFYFITPFKRVEMIIKIIDRII